MREQLWWYIARSGGIVALVMMGLSVLWGLFLSTKILDGRPSPRWLLDLHRWLGGSAVIFTAIHVLGLVLDSFVSFGLIDILVPFASAWEPRAVAGGVIAMWLLLAVQGTSLIMNRLPRKWWRAIHFTSFAGFFAGVIHGAMAGTDAGNPLYVGGIATMILATTFLTLYRILAARRSRARVALP